MLAVRGRFDGKVVVLDEPVPASSESEVLVLFKDTQGQGAEDARSARRRLRGSGRGLHLVEKLLADRRQDG